MAEPQAEQPKITPAQETEAKTRVILNEKSPAKDAGVQKRIDKLSENLVGQGPRSMLESIRAARMEASADNTEDNKALTEKTKHVVENNIGWGADEKGERNLGPEEKGRLKDANERTRDVTDYITKDFDALKPEQKAHILEDAGRMLKSIPEFKNYFDGLTNKGKLTIDNLVKNPEFRAKVKSVFEGKLDPANLTIVNNESFKQTVVDANKELQDTITEREKKEKDLLAISVDIKNCDMVLAKFALNGGVDGAKGEFLLKLEQLRADAPKNQAEIDKRQAEITEIDKQMFDLALVYGALSTNPNIDHDKFDAEISKLDTKREGLEKEKSGFAAKIEGITKLEEMEKSFKGVKEDLGKKEPNLKTEYEDAMAAEREKNAALVEAKAGKADVEQRFINDINNTFKDAMGAHIQEKAEAVEDEGERIDNENAATDEFGKKLKNGLNNRWTKDKKIKEGVWPWPGRKERDSKVPDIDQINTDFSLLLKQGPDAVLKAVLTENCGITEVDGGPTVEEQVNAKMEDKEFVEREGKKVIDQVLSRKFQTGQITGAEAAYISNADWGQGAIQRAIEKNKEIQSAFKSLSEQGVLKGSTPAEWVKEIAKSNKTNSSIFTLLFSLLLLPVLGAKELSDTLKESYNSAAGL